MPKTQKDYQAEIVAKLSKSLKGKNPHSLPTIKKVTLNYRVSEARENKEALAQAQEELSVISGQKPTLCCARLSESGFKIRQGDPLALKVTLRSTRMYHFLEKLLSLVLPQVRDFRGLPSKSFDQSGNYSFTLKDQTVFPEINLDKIKKIRPLQVVINISTSSPLEAKMLLSALGLPFEKEENPV